MRIGTNLILTACLALGLTPVAQAADEKAELANQKDKVSYSIGMNIGANLKRGGYQVDVDVLANAIKDVLADKPLKLTETEAREVMNAYNTELRAKREEERKELAEKNQEAGEKFLAENAKKTGVKTLSVTLPDGTNAVMQYKVITEGTGAIPGSNDTVTVNYRGTLIDGKEFDSSAKHGQPAKFQVNRVIRGWTTALEHMKVGSKWEVFIPSSLAYGDHASGPIIEPGSTLIFEIELLNAEAAAPPPPAQPLTSDIIKVPSAEELKKGAKVEILKPEDVERHLREATNKASQK